MALSEFDIIGRYFKRGPSRDDVLSGVGDDCALLRPPPGTELAVTVDTLVEGVHYPAETDPVAVGHKTLAASLSDLASMGAEPAWVTLAACFTDVDEPWTAAFAEGLFRLAGLHGVELIGGDTVHGPCRSFTLQAIGLLPTGKALRRGGARPGDLIYVTGTLGDAGLGLEVALGRAGGIGADCSDYLRGRLDFPAPRVAEGRALHGLANAAIDISDGVVADLGHILAAGGVGATVRTEDLPLSSCLRQHTTAEKAARLALTAGDDYELCFTVPPPKRDAVEAVFADFACGCTIIGEVESDPGLRVSTDGRRLVVEAPGYDHFAGAEGTGE